ncbi:hypothetical protein IWX90DRAFT_87466 [Phyllosticta citrichinensis]|uniref:Uncharacterized protein n=1 Tax=Phyllosticta citrichinensis TaxID=1130410 RepID=A0ABR1XFE7_9PEZI
MLTMHMCARVVTNRRQVRAQSKFEGPFVDTMFAAHLHLPKDWLSQNHTGGRPSIEPATEVVIAISNIHAIKIPVLLGVIDPASRLRTPEDQSALLEEPRLITRGAPQSTFSVACASRLRGLTFERRELGVVEVVLCCWSSDVGVGVIGAVAALCFRARGRSMVYGSPLSAGEEVEVWAWPWCWCSCLADGIVAVYLLVGSSGAPSAGLMKSDWCSGAAASGCWALRSCPRRSSVTIWAFRLSR